MLFSVIPNLPQPGSQFVAVADFIRTFIGGAFQFLVHIYTPPLMSAIMAMVVALFVFNLGWYPLKWILIKFHILKGT